MTPLKGIDIKRIYGIRGIVPVNIDLKDNETYNIYVSANDIAIYDNQEECIYHCKFIIK